MIVKGQVVLRINGIVNLCHHADQIIPVDMSGAAPGSRGAGWAYTPFLVRVPAEAEQHPIWRIVDDPLRNREILARLPQFYGTNLVDRVKPGGTVLGVTDRQLPGAGGIMPVFACQAYGRGRTFAMTTDTTTTGRAGRRKFRA